MSSKSPLVQRRFRINVDIETTINAEPDKTIGSHQEHVQFHQAFVQKLLAQPALLNKLLRYYAVVEFREAEKMLTREYGKTSDQQLLQPIIKELDPAAQAYFTEEVEAGISVPYFDGCEAVVQNIQLTELDR